MTDSRTRRKPAKFGTNAKTITATLAVAALVGSWNLVGHLDAAQASDSVENDESALLDIKLPTPTPSPMPTLKPLVIAPLPTLRPVGTLLQADTQIVVPANSSALGLDLPPIAALAPLPEMAPLPSMPSLPPPPPSGSGGGGGGGGGGGSSSSRSGGS